MNPDRSSVCDQFRLAWPDRPGDAALAAHRVACPACARWADGWARIAAVLATPRDGIEARPLWTERVVGAVLYDARVRRHRRRWAVAFAGVAAAAAVFVVVALQVTPEPPAVVQADPPPALSAELAGARQAVLGLSKRAVDEAALPGFGWPALGLTGVAPPAPALAGAKQGMADGVEPVAASARRAARLLWRETKPNASPPLDADSPQRKQGTPGRD